MKVKHTICLFIALFFVFSAHAQFVEIGNEPSNVKWSQIATKNYKIIYPRGLDSLARVYATSLEQSALTIGNTVGYTPNQMFRKPMPVVLHPHTSYSNGQVSWTPRKVDLYTVPDAYTPDASPWEKHLVLHESRHVAQMQYNTDGIFKAGKVLSGELLAGALAAIYCGQDFFEGDAVVAETAMTQSGRGRNADFLEYHRVHISGANTRDYYQWRYSSQKTYIPDYYRVGYLNFAGIRSLYNAPDFTARYFQNLKEAHGISFFNFSKTTKQLSGKGRKDTFKEITDSLQAFWLADEQKRAPFIEAQQLTPHSKKFSEYKDIVSAGGELYAVRTSIVDVPKIVKLSADGSAQMLALISSMHSPLKYSSATGEIVWSEFRPSARWELRSFSEIRAMDSDGKVRTLTQGKRYYNPDPHPSEAKLAVVCYPEEGGSQIRVISTEDASSFAVFVSPSEVQYLAPLWVGNELYASAIVDGGIAIYKVSDASVVMPPAAANLDRLFTDGERIYFSCDVSGVNELYSILLDGSNLQQHTVLRRGGGDFLLLQDELYFTELAEEGRAVMKISAGQMMHAAASLKAQEGAFPFVSDLVANEAPVDYTAPVQIGEVKPYSKLANSFKIHSWVPVYVDPDAVSSMSLSSLTTAAGIGATAFFQNELGTLSGTVAYSARQEGVWRNSGHMSLKFSAWAPVIEAKLYLNTRDAIEYKRDIENNHYVLKTRYLDRPVFTSDLKAYIPINLSRGGLNIGIIPQINAVLSNDYLVKGADKAPVMRQLSSLRAYMMQSIPNSRIYPRWGVGAELAYSSRPFVTEVFNPSYYAHLYAYTPGLHPTHGFKWAALYEQTRNYAIFSESLTSTAPRGYSSASNLALAGFNGKLRLSVDYAMPILPLDWSGLGAIAYLRNFELTPFFDFSLYSDGENLGSLYSTGADFTVRLGNLAFIPYDTRIGVRASYLGGSLYGSLKKMGAQPQPYSINMIFTIDL